MTSTAPPRPVLLRPLSSAVTFWVVLAAVVLFMGDALVRGAWDFALHGIAVGGAVVWLIWLVSFRPSIAVASDELVVVNPGRITRIPWPQVADVRRRLQIVVDLHDGSSVQCWGSPFLSKAPVRYRRERGLRVAPKSYSPSTNDGALETVRAAWSSAAPGDRVVVRSWDAVALIAGAFWAIAIVLVFILA